MEKASTADTHPEPRFTVGRSILFSAILFCAVFGLLEGGLRLAGVERQVRPQILLRRIDVDITFPFMRPDRDLMWSPKPGFRGQFLGSAVTINQLGLRGREVALPKPPGRRRIVCFGDSVTFGYGVSDGETYSAELERALVARGVNADVVDAGVTGFTSHQVRRLLERVLPGLEADVVTVMIGWNDASHRPVDDREYERRVRQTMEVDSVLDHLALYSFLKAKYLRYAIRHLPSRGQVHRVSLEQYDENLAAVIEACRRLGAQPVFIELPRRRGAGEPPADWDYPKAFEQAASRRGVPLLSAGPLGRRQGDASNVEDFIDTLHLSAQGNRLLGGVLAEQLIARHLM